jgi:hypothetical protein
MGIRYALKYTMKLPGELSGSQHGLLGYSFRLIFARKKNIHVACDMPDSIYAPTLKNY